MPENVKTRKSKTSLEDAEVNKVASKLFKSIKIYDSEKDINLFNLFLLFNVLLLFIERMVERCYEEQERQLTKNGLPLGDGLRMNINSKSQKILHE